MNLSTMNSSMTHPSPVENYLTIGLTGILVPLILIGNILVIVSYKSNRRLHTRTYTFLVSLAVSDLLVGGVSIPLWINCMAHYAGCSIALFKFFDLFGAFASILHLTAITIERYIAICRPYFHGRLSARYHKGTLVFVWVFSTLTASLSWYIPSEVHKQAYNCSVFVAGFILPVTTVISMYVGIFRAARSLLRRQQKPFLQNEGETRKRLREDHKVAVTVAVICGFFIVGWLPFFVLSIVASFCRRCLPSTQTDLLTLVAVVKWLQYSNSMVNPVVYALRDLEMRNTFMKILRIKKCRERFINAKTKMSSSYHYTERATHTLKENTTLQTQIPDITMEIVKT